MSAAAVLLISRVARTLRTIIGAPDYDGYLRHMRDRHPNEKPLTREEYARQRMDERYSRPGSRCC